MTNKKILLSIFIVFLIAFSVSSVSAKNVTDDIVATEDTDVVAIKDVELLAADPISPTTNTSDAIQTAVDRAEDGGIIDLSNYASYDITNNTISVSKDNLVIKGNGTTTIYGYGDGNGFFSVKSKGVIIQGLIFVDTNPKNNLTYDGNVAGWGIQFAGSVAQDGTVNNCVFHNFNQAIVVSSCNNITVKNSNFYVGY